MSDLDIHFANPTISDMGPIQSNRTLVITNADAMVLLLLESYQSVNQLAYSDKSVAGKHLCIQLIVSAQVNLALKQSCML